MLKTDCMPAQPAAGFNSRAYSSSTYLDAMVAPGQPQLALHENAVSIFDAYNTSFSMHTQLQQPPCLYQQLPGSASSGFRNEGDSSATFMKPCVQKVVPQQIASLAELLAKHRHAASAAQPSPPIVSTQVARMPAGLTLTNDIAAPLSDEGIQALTLALANALQNNEPGPSSLLSITSGSQDDAHSLPDSGENNANSQQSNTSACASLYVRNLPPEASELFLYQRFAPFGALLSCKIKTDPVTRKCRGVGFVNYVSSKDAVRAMTSLHNTKGLNGRQMHITLQAPRAVRALAAAAVAAGNNATAPN